MKQLKSLSFLCLLFLPLLEATNAAAQQNSNISKAEDVAIAFYKVGGLTPKFSTWIEKEEPYTTTPLARRPKVMEKQKLRLNDAYQNFNSKENFLTILTKVKMNLRIEKEIIENKNNDEEIVRTYFLDIDFGRESDLFYIPYEHADQNFMVVPDEIEQLKIQELTENDYQYLQRHITKGKYMPFILRLRAHNADTEKPYHIDGLDQWALKTEIVSMETWHKNGSLLWEYSAPWYISPNSQKIKKLYNERKEHNDFISDGYINPITE